MKTTFVHTSFQIVYGFFASTFHTEKILINSCCQGYATRRPSLFRLQARYPLIAD